jgi:hypothetical protein
MKATSFLVALLAACASLAPRAAAAHPDDVNNAKPRTGVVSDEVARQRLQSAGVQQVAVVKREGSLIILSGSIDGNPVTLHMNAQSGNVVDPRDPQRAIALPRAEAVRPMVSGPQVPVPRSRLSDPALMREAIAPRVN